MKKYQHYIDARGEVLPTPHRNNDSCRDLKIIWKNESLRNRELIGHPTYLPKHYHILMIRST